MDNKSPVALKSVKEASGILGIHYKSLYRLLKLGKYPFYKVGRRVMVDIDDILRRCRNDGQRPLIES